jgi:hypothetical protein
VAQKKKKKKKKEEKRIAPATPLINTPLIHRYWDRFSVIKKIHIQTYSRKYWLKHRSGIVVLFWCSFLFCRLTTLADQHVTKLKSVLTLYIISIYHFLLSQKLFFHNSLMFPCLPNKPKEYQKTEQWAKMEKVRMWVKAGLRAQLDQVRARGNWICELRSRIIDLVRAFVKLGLWAQVTS